MSPLAAHRLDEVEGQQATFLGFIPPGGLVVARGPKCARCRRRVARAWRGKGHHRRGGEAASRRFAGKAGLDHEGHPAIRRKDGLHLFEILLDALDGGRKIARLRGIKRHGEQISAAHRIPRLHARHAMADIVDEDIAPPLDLTHAPQELALRIGFRVPSQRRQTSLDWLVA